MDFSYNKEQLMLKDSAKTFFSKEWMTDQLRETLKSETGFSSLLWQKMVELG